jgi:hypothetical protein
MNILNTRNGFAANGAPKLRLVPKAQPNPPQPAQFAGTSAVVALIGAWRLVEAARLDVSASSFWTAPEVLPYIERIERAALELRDVLDDRERFDRSHSDDPKEPNP